MAVTSLPICPPQKTPYQQEGLESSFNRTWWLYFYNLGQIVNSTSRDLPFVTPEEFGAVGDGVTDDTIAWQNTINAAVALNKPIFAAGTYLVSRSGSWVLPWDSTTHYYCLLITNPISIMGWGVMLTDISDSVVSNIFLVQQTSDVRVLGLRGEGTGTGSTQKLYDGALFAFDRCSNCLVNDVYTNNLRGNTIFFQGSDSEVQGGFSTVPGVNKAGSHFASYGCSRVTIRDCTAYGGTTDGDIVHFGENVDGLATANRTLNCAIYNYEYGDATKTIVFDEAQGFLLDSGQDFGMVADCYAYGYFYGVDIKTTCEGVIARNNTIEKCKVGIAVRLGEGNAQTFNTLVAGNCIRPMGGNGNTQNLFQSLTDTVGIWLQNAIGVDVVDNTIEASYLFGAGEQDYIPIFCNKSYDVTPISSVNDGWSIRNNRLLNEMNIGGTYTYTKNISVFIQGVETSGIVDTSGTAVTRISGDNFVFDGSWNGLTILIAGVPYLIASVADADNMTLQSSAGVTSGQTYVVQNIILRGDVSGNDFKLYSADDTATGSPVQVYFAKQFHISRNNFSAYTGQYQTIIVQNVTQLKIDGNTFPGAPGYIDLTDCIDVTVSGNEFRDEGRNLNTAQPVPVIHADGVDQLVVIGNILNQSSIAGADDGRMVESSASGNGSLVLSNNVMTKQIFTVDWYQWNNVSLNSSQNISQVGNVLNGTNSIGSAVQSRTFVITSDGTNWVVDGVTGDALAAALTQDIDFNVALPSYGKIRAVNFTVLTGFSGTGFTSVTAQFSDGTGGPGAYVAVPVDITTTGDFQDFLPLLASVLQTSSNLQVTVTANQNLDTNTLTGSFSLSIDWINETVSQL